MASAAEMTDGENMVRRARVRALIIPREHGAWGLLLIPLFTGVAASLAAENQSWQQILFVVAAFSLFWLRTPVESLLGSGVVVAHTPEERRTAYIASAVLAATSVACLGGLMWGSRNLELLAIGLVAACALVAQGVMRKFGRKMRMASQLAGAVGLTATAPAAYYLGTGHLNARAIVLWVTNWLFAWNQIHFVQTRIHAGRAGTFKEKLAKGRAFFLGQALLLFALVVAALWRSIPPLIVLAFAPALFRGTRWFFHGPEPLDVKKLGWSEMKQGAVFGILLAIAFLVP